MPLDDTVLGLGVYTPNEAARLAGTNSQQVLRWTKGASSSAPLWLAHFQSTSFETTSLSFLDLVELRVVAAMRKAGITLQSIRFAIQFAQDKLQLERPLSSKLFKTDGTELLMDAVENDGEYVSLSRKRPGQKVFREIISQSLNDLEYDEDVVSRWRPKNFKQVVVDPQRHFGDPILDKWGVSTCILNREYAQFGDAKYLAQIYEIPLSVVRVALKFESELDKIDGKRTI